MNETLDLNDMNISLKTFGLAPIKAEGQAVGYDCEQDLSEAQDVPSYEVDIEIDGAEVINE